MIIKEAIDVMFRELVRRVDTPEEEAYRLAIEAMELQVAKKPKDIKKVCGIQFGDCPNCVTELRDDVQTYRCPNCTQILDWSEE